MERFSRLWMIALLGLLLAACAVEPRSTVITTVSPKKLELIEFYSPL